MSLKEKMLSKEFTEMKWGVINVSTTPTPAH